MRQLTIALLVATAFTVPIAQGKQSPSTGIAFEVASIKPSKTLDAGGSMGFQAGGGFRAVNIDLRTLIASAYQNGAELQVVGGPDWLSSQRYDVIAKVAGDLAAMTPAELLPRIPLLLQSLLEDRCKLKFHREARQLQMFALVLSRRDGVLGPQLHSSTKDCGPGKPSLGCGIRYVPGHFVGGGVSLRTLVSFISNRLQRSIIDRTGLTGLFDLDLQWSPDQSTSDQPSLIGALKEQLGLKLDSTKGSVDVLVIDYVDKPTED